MKTIHKWTFQITDSFSLMMPEDASILHVAKQHHEMYDYGAEVWALVDTDKPMVERKFQLRGTGHDADGLDPANHVGTFLMARGSLVFHLFEEVGS